MLGEVHAAAQEFDTLLLKKLALERSVGFADQDASRSAHYALPGDAASRGAGSHGAAGSARASGQSKSARHLSISQDAPARNSFYQPVDRSPGQFSSSLTQRQETSSAGFAMQTA